MIQYKWGEIALKSKSWFWKLDLILGIILVVVALHSLLIEKKYFSTFGRSIFALILFISSRKNYTTYKNS